MISKDRIKNKMPRSLPIKTGVLGIPIFFDSPCKDLKAFKKSIAEINHLLCLLDEEDVSDVYSDIDNRDPFSTLLIWTDSRVGLSYAYDHQLLCEYQTVIATVEADLNASGIKDDDAFALYEEAESGGLCITRNESGVLVVHLGSNR